MRGVAQAGTSPDGARDAHGTEVLGVEGLSVTLGGRRVLDGVDLILKRREILGIAGASGSGKSVLMRAILGLVARDAGEVRILGQPTGTGADALDALPGHNHGAIESRCGVVFQQGALFSSLTVRQNVQVPLRAHGASSPRLMDELALLKLEMARFPHGSIDRMPGELSVGMARRAALARALALDPELLFLDEPTAGLDPSSASALDELIADLRHALNLSVFMITHDLDSMMSLCSSVAILWDGRFACRGTIGSIAQFNHPWAISYFGSARARARLSGDAPGAAKDSPLHR